MSMRIALVSDGDSTQFTTNSGVALGLRSALQHRSVINVAIAINPIPTGLRRYLLALATVRPSRHWWWSTFNFGMLNFLMRSSFRDRELRKGGDVDFVIHVGNIYRPARVPYAAYIDSTSRLAERSWRRWRPTWVTRRFRYRMERKYYSGAHVVLTTGENARESVIRDYGVPADRVLTVGGGVNFDPLPEVTDRTDGLNVLWVGVDFERKGGDLLLNAFQTVREEVPGATLTLVGSPPSPRPMPGVTVIAPTFDREFIAALFSAADLFVHPARHEPYGLVVQEAMAFGLPCVVTDVGVLGQTVMDGATGTVILSEDADRLAGAIIDLLRDPIRRRRYGDNGRRRVEDNFTWNVVAERVETAIGAVQRGDRVRSGE